jgi:hypothetical protein
MRRAPRRELCYLPTLAAVWVLVVFRPGHASHQGSAREWRGALRERLKLEHLDLLGGANGVAARPPLPVSAEHSSEDEWAGDNFSLGPRSAGVLQTDLELSRKILERAVGRRAKARGTPANLIRRGTPANLTRRRGGRGTPTRDFQQDVTDSGRSVRGVVTLQAHPLLKSSALDVSLIASKNSLMVRELSEPHLDLVQVPLWHLIVQMVRDYDNMFHILIDAEEDAANQGIFVVLRDRLLRDSWLHALSAVDVRIKGWHPSASTSTPGTARTASTASEGLDTSELSQTQQALESELDSWLASASTKHSQPHDQTATTPNKEEAASEMPARMDEPGIKSCLNSKPPPITTRTWSGTTREWSGRLSERAKRESLDLQQISAHHLDRLEQGVSCEEVHFSLGPRLTSNTRTLTSSTRPRGVDPEGCLRLTSSTRARS